VPGEAGLSVDGIPHDKHLAHEQVLASDAVRCRHGDEEGLPGLVQPAFEARQLLDLAIGRRHSPDAAGLASSDVGAVAGVSVSTPMEHRRAQRKQGLFTLLWCENRPHYDALKAMAG
jgi:hypothetical protein